MDTGLLFHSISILDVDNHATLWSTGCLQSCKVAHHKTQKIVFLFFFTKQCTQYLPPCSHALLPSQDKQQSDLTDWPTDLVTCKTRRALRTNATSPMDLMLSTSRGDAWNQSSIAITSYYCFQKIWNKTFLRCESVFVHTTARQLVLSLGKASVLFCFVYTEQFCYFIILFRVYITERHGELKFDTQIQFRMQVQFIGVKACSFC